MSTEKNAVLRKIAAFILLACLLAASGCSGGKDDPAATDDTSAGHVSGPSFSAELTYDYDLSEYITVPDHSAMTLECTLLEVGDRDVDIVINEQLVSSGTSKEITDRAAQAGDRVTYDSEGKRASDGVEFEKGTERVALIGGAAYLEGFTENFIGVRKGDVKEFGFTFPDDYYNASLAGEEVLYSVTITKVEEVTPAALDDAFAASLGLEGVTDVASYREYVRGVLEARAAAENAQTMRDAAYDVLLEGAEVKKFPEKEYAYYKKICDNTATTYARINNTTFDQYVTQQYGSTEAYDEYVKKYCENNLKKDMLMWSLAREYGVSVSEEEYQKELQYGFDNYAASYGFSEIEKFEDAFSEELTTGLLLKSALDAVVATATVS